MSIINIIKEELDNVFEYERRERDPNRQPRVGREFGGKKNTYAKSRESSPEVRNMREQITKYVYEARDLVRKNFGVTPPRVTYRVVDWTPNEVIKMDNAVGCATGYGTRVILIPASTFNSSYNLRHIVFHELLHAIYCVAHDKQSKLMHPNIPITPLSDDEMNNWYIKHVRESGKSDLSDERGERRRY